MSKIQFGASFSQRHLKYLGLDPQKALKEFTTLNFSWIRLSCYWNEIEKTEGKFNFSEIENLIKFCDKEKINVVLTIGMKAQRYPEFYYPEWINKKDFKHLQEKVLIFIENCVKHYKKYKCIKVWQIENEPLDPAGPNWQRVNHHLLETEVMLVRKLDPNRKILINLWGNELSIRKVYKKAIKLADIVGLDIYLKHPIPFLKFWNKLIGPLDSQEKIKKVGQDIKDNGREFWITELQMEPWEKNELVSQKENSPSFSPPDFKKNLDYARFLKCSVILLWGFEYWFWKKAKGDIRYWENAKKILYENNKTT